MVAAERLLADRQGALEERLGIGVAAALVQIEGLLTERCCFAEPVVRGHRRDLGRDRERKQHCPKKRSHPTEIHMRSPRIRNPGIIPAAGCS